MRLDRRDFLRKAAFIGGMAAIQPWQWLRILKADHLEQVYTQLMDWDLEAMAASLVTQTGTLLAPASVSNILTQSSLGGDGTWTVTDETSTWLRPSGTTNVLKVVAAGQTVSSDYFIRLSIPTPQTGLAIRSLHLAVYRPAGVVSGGTAVSYRLIDSGIANGWRYNFTLPTITQQPRIGAYCDRLKTGFDSTTGSPVDTTSFARLELFLTVSSPTTLYISPVYINYRTKPQIVITSDDGLLTDYTHTFNYIESKRLGLVGGLAINSTHTNINQRVTTAQLLEMQRAGWSMHNHTTTHVNLADTGIATATRLAAVTDCQAWLNLYGLTSGNKRMILPYGNNTGGAEDIVMAAGYNEWALAAEGATSTWDGLADPHLIPRYQVDSTTSLATIRAAILSAINLGQSLVLYWHNPGGITDITVSTMQATCDYLAGLKAAGVIDVPNFQNFLTNTRPRVVLS